MKEKEVKKELLKFEHTDELLTNKAGLIVIDEYWKKLRLSEKINTIFGKPGSNRGFMPSKYIPNYS